MKTSRSNGTIFHQHSGPCCKAAVTCDDSAQGRLLAQPILAHDQNAKSNNNMHLTWVCGGFYHELQVFEVIHKLVT